ncbi:hypothetical protein B0O80DRAFT_465490 [Mortierella sp. GBAus27b]|nr:hypothetical protein B0O80DRAFT_465490 [Mortierella sp. GBAus27b]
MIDVDTVYGAVRGTTLANSRSSPARNTQLQDKLTIATYSKATTSLSTSGLGSSQELQSPRQSGSIGLLKSLTNSLTGKPWQSKTSSDAQKTEKTETRSDTRSIRSLLSLRRQTPPQQPQQPSQSLSSSPPQQPQPCQQKEQQEQQPEQVYAQEQPRILESSSHGPQLPQELPQGVFEAPLVLPPLPLMEEESIAPVNHARPLPTPPKARRVRWAVFQEVIEIENIDDLTMLGYYDDYDSELGWNYRNESLDDAMDGYEYEYDHEYEDDGDEDDDDDDLQPSPSVQLRTPVSYNDLMYHQPLHPSLHQPFYQTQLDDDDDDDHHHSRTHSEEGRYAESEASVIDDESLIAEDDIMYRFGMDGLYTMSCGSMASLQNYQGILQRFQNFDTRVANKANGTLEPTSTSEAKELPASAGAPSPCRLKSPPPPSRMRYSPPLPSPAPSPAPLSQPEQQHQNVEVAFEVEEVDVVSMVTEAPVSMPMEIDEPKSMVTEVPESRITELPQSTVAETPRSPRAPSRIPRMDRSKIMEEVAQRKRDGSGTFAKRRASMGSIGDHYRSSSSSSSTSSDLPDMEKKHGLWRIDTSSTSTPSLDSGSSSDSSESSESESNLPSPPVVGISGPRLTRKQPMSNRWSTGQYCIRAGADPVYSIQAPHIRSATPLVAC